MTRLNVLPPNPEEQDSEALRLQGRFPSWLHRKLPEGSEIFETNKILRKHNLNTVCNEAKCPNRLECFSKRTATFLALGSACTRNCGFCDIDFTKAPLPPQADEPERIAKSIRDLDLRHAVITMVARDDLPDHGSGHMAAIIRASRRLNPNTTIEVLTSDFSGDLSALDAVLAAKPEIFNHNLETVRSITPRIRHRATYDRSLLVLRHAAQNQSGIAVKSGIMLGFGESIDEVQAALRDLADAGCSIITIGQYLQASSSKLRVKEFVLPETFQQLVDYGKSLGVPHMHCGPFVRSSYNAGQFAPIQS